VGSGCRSISICSEWRCQESGGYMMEAIDLGRVYCRYTFRREAFAFVLNAIGSPTAFSPSKCREILSRSDYYDVSLGFGRVYCQYAFHREN
jgi:hypothetical protein